MATRLGQGARELVRDGAGGGGSLVRLREGIKAEGERG